jgi:hypothetical protein
VDDGLKMKKYHPNDEMFKDDAGILKKICLMIVS